MAIRQWGAAITAGAMALAAFAAAGPAVAQVNEVGGEVGGEGSRYLLNKGWSVNDNRELSYGRAADQVYVGDWDANGTDTLTVRRGATYFVANSVASGNADRVVTYGRPGDVVLVGDWDGDGVDTLAVRRGSTYHIKNSLNGGNADRVVTYGRPGDVVLVGDWDGDGVDTLAVRRGDTYYLKNSLSGGNADKEVPYGRVNDVVLVGDWNGDGVDTLAVRRADTYLIKNSLSGGNADRVFRFGAAGDAALVGDWDGDGTDTLGLRLAGTFDASPAPSVPPAGPARPGPGEQRPPAERARTPLPIYVSPTADSGTYIESYEARRAAGWASAFYTYWPREISWNTQWAQFVKRYPEGVPVLGSPKGVNPTNVRGFLDKLPQAWRDKWTMAYYQEPEDNFTTAAQRTQFRAQVKQMADLVRPYGVSNAVHLQEWTINPYNNHSWAGEKALSEFFNAKDVDRLSWSLYPAEGRSMREGIDRIKAFSEKYAPGVPWGITAAGSPVKGSAPIGGAARAKRAQLVRDAAEYTAAVGGQAFGWFDFDEYNPGRDQLASKDPALYDALGHASRVERTAPR